MNIHFYKDDKDKDSYKNLICQSLVILLLSGSLIACDSGDVVKDKSPSSNPSDPFRTGDKEDDKEAFLIECVSFDKSEISGKTSTYYKPLTGEYISNYIRLHLSGLPSTFFSSDSQYLRVRLWKEDTPGNRVYKSHPVPMFFVSRVSGNTLQFNHQLDYLSKNNIQKVISDHSLGVTTDNFFNEHLIILADVPFEYHVLQIALFDTTSETKAPLSWVDSLIPAFDAHPKDYIKNHQSSALQHLHPYYTQQDNGWTSAQYRDQAAHTCQGF